MGFKQRDIFTIINDKTFKDQWEKLKYLYIQLIESKKADIFFHNYIRTILIKKKDEADEQKDLRTISIIPAWLMILEKLINPIAIKLYDGDLSTKQYGFRPNRDCNLAKAIMAFNGTKLKYNKILLIDIRKAYDSVNITKLKEIINNKYGDKGKLLIHILDIYQKLVMIIEENQINIGRGLPQGSNFSPLMF